MPQSGRNARHIALCSLVGKRVRASAAPMSSVATSEQRLITRCLPPNPEPALSNSSYISCSLDDRCAKAPPRAVPHDRRALSPEVCGKGHRLGCDGQGAPCKVRERKVLLMCDWSNGVMFRVGFQDSPLSVWVLRLRCPLQNPVFAVPSSTWRCINAALARGAAFGTQRCTAPTTTAPKLPESPIHGSAASTASSKSVSHMMCRVLCTPLLRPPTSSPVAVRIHEAP